jgi:hypothetical protein
LLCTNGTSQTRSLAKVTGNYQRLNRHEFTPVAAKLLRLHVTATNGAAAARVYEIRCYAQIARAASSSPFFAGDALPRRPRQPKHGRFGETAPPAMLEIESLMHPWQIAEPVILRLTRFAF